MKIIGFMGFKGAGKDTAAKALLQYDTEWTQLSFATALKNCLCAIFGWEYSLIEGTTAKSREWREQVDTWWANKLDIPNFTPRWAMTTIGTDVLRARFNDNIWIHALEKQMDTIKCNVVITDCRYPNEAKLIRDRGGVLVHVDNGVVPEFYKYSSVPQHSDERAAAETIMRTQYSHVHDSEWAWNNIGVNYRILNTGSIDDLYTQVHNIAGYLD